MILEARLLARIEEIGLCYIGYILTKRYRIVEDDALSAETELTQSATMTRGAWSIRLQCRMRLTATPEAFQFSGDLQAFENTASFALRDSLSRYLANCFSGFLPQDT